LAASQVLLADDDRMFVSHMHRFLGRYDWRIEIAGSPDEALEALRREPLQIVVLEPNQRGMPWVRFMRGLRSAGPSSSFVVATSFPSAAMAAEASELGVLAFLRKPVEPYAVVRAFSCSAPAINDEVVLSDEPTLEQHEWEYLNLVLRRCNGNISEASRRLAIPRQTLYYKLRKQPRCAPVASTSACGTAPPRYERNGPALW
jgi:two-component system, response regulator RegA